MSNQAGNAAQKDLVFRGPGKRIGSWLGAATEQVSCKFQHRRVHRELEKPLVMVQQTDDEFIPRDTGRARGRTQHQFGQVGRHRLAYGVLQHDTPIGSDCLNCLLDII